MNANMPIAAEAGEPAVQRRTVAAHMPEEPVLIRAAAKIARDLSAPSPRIYWADLLASAILGYAALAVALMAGPLSLRLVAGFVAILALYRAASFIHELSHIKSATLPGFRVAWNILVGIPMMMPSFMYEGVHNQHHMPARYATNQDPEYLPLALMPARTLFLFIAVAALAPLGFLIRYAVLAPLSAIVPPLRRTVVERYSALAINPAFRRKLPQGNFRRDWHLAEAGTSLWTIGLLAAGVTGLVPLHGLLIYLAILSCVAVLNQVRTLAAHLWENDGDPVTITGQYLDSVNVPPPGLLPEAWAPVGLRYHAVHHLLPGIPYHALGEAHRRLAAEMPADSAFHGANHDGLGTLALRLFRAARKAVAQSDPGPELRAQALDGQGEC